MDRRTFMTTGAWLSAAGLSLPWMARAVRSRDTIAVVDTGLARGRAFVDYVKRLEMPVFDIGDDVGVLWYATLAPRLAATPGLLLGVTRASDYFVLEQLALNSGRMLRHKHEQGTGLSAPVAFLIGPAR
ncbi:hypothetical protein [Paraburkholderia sp.]|jgi:hypothetical protein|uniref:hypothetical protein n=1 Tax=Paraburkholderia sp. TaxID=1926495 RepID=UPI002F3EA8C8